ncbi:MAG: glycosyltransferase family 4 protein [Thermoleophilia bacterium]
MKIAVLGTKGIPARFGGIERHCEELYPRLVARGHEVTVFVRSWFAPGRDSYKGVRLRVAPTLNVKGLDAVIHTAAGSLMALTERFDIVHYHAIGPSLFSFMPKLRGEKSVATVHALDWQRAKWGRGARTVLQAGEWASTRFPDRTIVVSRDLQAYFQEKYHRDTVYIPNGVTPAPFPGDMQLLQDFGIEDGGYILFLGRLVPEKGCHDLIAAYLQSGVRLPLVIAGGSSHSDDYVRQLQASAGAGSNIIFTGNVEGELLQQLSAHAALFVLPSMLEGLPIVVLEMLSLGVPVLASDIGPAREVLADGEFGALYRAGDVTDLRDSLLAALDDLPALRQKAEAGRLQVGIENDWDRIAAATEKVYQEVLRG